MPPQKLKQQRGVQVKAACEGGIREGIGLHLRTGPHIQQQIRPPQDKRHSKRGSRCRSQTCQIHGSGHETVHRRGAVPPPKCPICRCKRMWLRPRKAVRNGVTPPPPPCNTQSMRRAFAHGLPSEECRAQGLTHCLSAGVWGLMERAPVAQHRQSGRTLKLPSQRHKSPKHNQHCLFAAFTCK